MMNKQSIAVFISGSGSTLQALIDYQNKKETAYKIAIVISNNSEAYGLKRAQQANITTAYIDHRQYNNRQEYEINLIKHLEPFDVQWIVLAGFMRKLSPYFIKHYSEKIVNIHPSLLPKYKGLNTYERALLAEEKYHGTSVHLVDEELDSGRILAQARTKINPQDTISTLQQKTKKLEQQIYPMIVNWLANDTLTKSNQKWLLNNQSLPDHGFQMNE